MVKYLACRFEDLSLIPRTYFKSCTCNPSVKEAMTESQGLLAGQINLLDKLQARVRLNLKAR